MHRGWADVAERDAKYKATALLWSARKGHLLIVQWLLQHGGASVRERGYYDLTALLNAAEEGHHVVVQWLLQRGGATTTEGDGLGSTALLLSARKGHQIIVQWLKLTVLTKRRCCGRLGKAT